MSHAAHCDYCGLPLASSHKVAADDAPRYCCFGCRFAAEVNAQGEGDGTSRVQSTMTRLGLALFFSMNVMVFTFFLWSQAENASASAAILYDVARYACLLFTLPVLLLLGGPLVEDACAELRSGRASLNLLLLSGVAASFAYSLWAVFAAAGHVYFEVACMVLVAVTLGRWLEASGKLRTTAELRRLEKLLPDVVRRVTASGEEVVPLDAVTSGDVLRILPGEAVPVDGQIVRGTAAIDEATVTGESLPVVKECGHKVFSGTMNLDGELTVEATASAGSGTLERLIAAVMQAVSGRTRFQRLAETIAAWFLPAILLISVVTFAYHYTASGLSAAILNGLAVIVISCPCALGLATPLALWAAVGTATRRHVLIRDADALTQLAAARTFGFDKTGTLTSGCEVAEVLTAPDVTSEELVSLAAALAQGSNHPLSQAIVNYARQHQVSASVSGELRSHAGRGMEGRSLTDELVLLGSARWMDERQVHWGDLRERLPQSSDITTVVCAAGGKVLGALLLRESLRESAVSALQALQQLGARTEILSGDHPARAQMIATLLGARATGAMLPEDKLRWIRDARAGGETVVMTGDGLNDAPALAAASVGIALGCGADVARWSGSICLLNDDLELLPWMVELSRSTVRTIRWNLLWAFGYNAICIPLAAAGWLHPAVAAAAMVVSSLLVVSNSLRLASEEEHLPQDGLKLATSNETATTLVRESRELMEPVA